MIDMAIDDDIDIFISCSVKDSLIVHNYVQFLENAGFKVWYDRKGLYSGLNTLMKLSKQLRDLESWSFFLR